MEEYEILLLQKLGRPASDEISAVERFIASIEAHIANEAAFLREYADTIRQHDSPLVRLILELILADEQKHHQLLERILGRLDADLNLRNRAEPRSHLAAIDKIDLKPLIALTGRFLDEERKGIEKTRDLMRTANEFYDGLLAMLLGTIVKDSEKHMVMLKFLRKQLR